MDFMDLYGINMSLKWIPNISHWLQAVTSYTANSSFTRGVYDFSCSEIGGDAVDPGQALAASLGHLMCADARPRAVQGEGQKLQRPCCSFVAGNH